MSKNSVIINGVAYDAVTGMRLDNAPEQSTASEETHGIMTSETQPVSSQPTRTPQSNAHSLHTSPAKSVTLNRQFVTKQPSKQPVTRTVRPRQAVIRSSHISKFAPHPVTAPRAVGGTMDIAAKPHPVVARAEARQHVSKQVAPAQIAPKPSDVLKREAIEQAINKTPARKDSEKKHTKAARRQKRSRLMSFTAAGFALMLLAGYFTYINMPNLSVRVAAAQAGINATYPGYSPDGYRLNGPVAFSDGKVSLKFASNSGSQEFTVDQSKSNWDSTAVLDKYVKEKAGDNYLTYNDQGLTIYTFDSDAAWVNGGILYTVTGDAPLSGDQIRRIATSM